MVLNLTDEEKQYIVMEPFNWHIASNTPSAIKEKIERELALLREQENNVQ